MDLDEINKQDFQKLIEKYLDGETSLEEVKLLVNYYESFQQTHNWIEALGPEKNVKQRMLINILEVLQEEETKPQKVKPLNFKSIIKYAVAASIVLFISVTFLLNRNKGNQDTTPTIVNNDAIIQIGTDKATLTLEDGSNIILEKGKAYSSNNVKSNGEEVVYKGQNDVKSEIAYNYLTIPRGGQFYIKLSDGTNVWLNSESQLKFPVTFLKGETRQVELMYGEAYFDVSPSTLNNGSKFKVTNKGQEVEVLGTQFNIKAYKDDYNIYTTLVEGKVTVSSFQGEKQSLLPNQQSILEANTNIITVKSVDVYNEVSWKDGIFSFENLSLKEIMKVLSRWYDMDVLFLNNTTENEEFIGVLSKNQKIEDILLSIKNFGIIKEYKINGKTVVLK